MQESCPEDWELCNITSDCRLLVKDWELRNPSVQLVSISGNCATPLYSVYSTLLPKDWGMTQLISANCCFKVGELRNGIPVFTGNDWPTWSPLGEWWKPNSHHPQFYPDCNWLVKILLKPFKYICMYVWNNPRNENLRSHYGVLIFWQSNMACWKILRLVRRCSHIICIYIYRERCPSHVSFQIWNMWSIPCIYI